MTAPSARSISRAASCPGWSSRRQRIDVIGELTSGMVIWPAFQRLLLEGSYVALPFETGRPDGFGALALFDYQIPLSANWALDPTLFVEVADANANISQTESMRLVLGLNVLGYHGFRVMPQVDLVRSLGDTSSLNPWLEGETYNLVLSLVL